MDDRLLALCTSVRERFAGSVSEPVEAFGELSVEVDGPRIVPVATWFRDEGPFALLADLSCVDYLGIEPAERRFLVAYHLYSFELNARIRVRVFLPETEPRVASVAGVWPTANWHEREVFDFFGIEFTGHPDLRRIFMPDDWSGHPQRKDYPLGGVKVEYKGVMVPPPDVRRQPTTTTGYPGRTS